MNIERSSNRAIKALRAIKTLTCLLFLGIGVSILIANPSRATAAEAASPSTINGLWDGNKKQTANDKLTLSMGGHLFVELDGTGPLDAQKYVLYLNGQAVSAPSQVQFKEKSEERPRGLEFVLRRPSDDKYKAAWAAILGSAAWVRPMEVSVGTGQNEVPRLIGSNTTFDFNLLRTWWLLVAAGLAIAVLVGVLPAALHTAIVRDNVLPQIPWRQRPFSLGNCQMAFWFVLIFVSFVFLWMLLWDYNTITEGALTLMGIAAATGLGAAAANTTNADALKKADQTLREAGFNSRRDITALVAQLDDALAKKIDKEQELRRVGNQDVSHAQQLTGELKILDENINKWQTRKSIYDTVTVDYVSATYDPTKGRYRYSKFLEDLITDRDGDTQLHRVQIVGWTVVLGLVFLVGVYRDVAMPDFSNLLLALMAISGGSYVGFKLPAKA